jgi:GNAT superfamily N-acetyltransferase
LTQIPDDLNLFMACFEPNKAAFAPPPAGITLRPCRKDELPFWLALPFDDLGSAAENEGNMAAFFQRVYAPKGNLFFETCLVAADADDEPLGSCFVWEAYGCLQTLHWLKVKKGFEGLGIGRALISGALRGVLPEAYPVCLHTQPGSFRAIKLYSDFGFQFLTDEVIGTRRNDLRACLPLLKEQMPGEAFRALLFCSAAKGILRALEREAEPEF